MDGFSLPFASANSNPAMDLFALSATSSNATTSSSSGTSNSRESSSSSSNNSNERNQTSNGSKKASSEQYNTKCLDKLLKSSKDPKLIYEMIMKIIPSEYAKQIMENLDTIPEDESTTSLSSTTTTTTSASKSRSSVEKTNKRKQASTDNSEAEVVAKKKKEAPPPIKNLELFTEWKGKIEEVARMELPSLEELENLDELSENKKHIQINHKFLTQKKNNHTEQVRITYRNFFEKYPKLFYAFSYWTLNGKVKVIKEVFTHHPYLLNKITEIPEKYRNFWKEETKEDELL